MVNENTEKVHRHINSVGFALILARGGSKSIPLKNIAKLNGKPLIYYTIKSALDSGVFKKIIVSTDSPEIAHVCKAYDVEVLIRDAELSGDTISSYQSTLGVFDQMKNDIESFDWFMLLQPTSPFRTSLHIKEALGLFFEKHQNSVVSVSETSVHPYKCFMLNQTQLEYFGSKDYFETPRQKLPKAYHINGAIYVNTIRDFKSQHAYVGNDFVPYEMNANVSIDIDTPLDLKFAEYMMRES